MNRATFAVLLALPTFILIGCNTKPDPGHGPGHSQSGEKSQSSDISHKDHGKDAAPTALMVQTDPAVPKAGQTVGLTLMVHDVKGAMVKDFEVVHEQKIHLIIIRDGLDHFAHIHPEIDKAGNIRTKFAFPTGGMYRLYADHKPVGGNQATAIAEVKVAGDSPAPPILKPDAPGKVTGDGLRAEIATDNLKRGAEATIRFHLLDANGKAVTDLQPYMGERGHLVVVSRDGNEYVHAHPVPEKSAPANVVAFQAHFGKASLYKGWGQFQREGKVHVVPFVVEVK